jgi:hypothetical protein
VASSQCGHHEQQQHVTINGADFQKVVDYLKTIMGNKGGARVTPQPRKV